MCLTSIYKMFFMGPVLPQNKLVGSVSQSHGGETDALWNTSLGATLGSSRGCALNTQVVEMWGWFALPK